MLVVLISICFRDISGQLSSYVIAGVFTKESDVAAFTISAVDDPRTLNKVVYLRLLGNVYSMNELIEIWESKIGKTLRRKYVSEGELLTKIKGTS